MENTGISRERLFCQVAFLGVAYGVARYRNVPITRQGALSFALSVIFQLGSLHFRGSSEKKKYVNLFTFLSFALVANGVRKLDMTVQAKILSGGLLGLAQIVIVNYSLREEPPVPPPVIKAEQPVAPIKTEDWYGDLCKIYFKKFAAGNNGEVMFRTIRLLESLKKEFEFGCRYKERQMLRTPQRFWQLYSEKLENDMFPSETPQEFWNRFMSEKEEDKPSFPSFFCSLIRKEEDFQHLYEVVLPEDQTECSNSCKIVGFHQLSTDVKARVQDLVSGITNNSGPIKIELSPSKNEMIAIIDGKVKDIYLFKKSILFICENKDMNLFSYKFDFDFNNYVFKLDEIKMSYPERNSPPLCHLFFPLERPRIGEVF
ncbi:MAG: hypothetical protein H7A38_05435 [Chlamydiales bacterium]|nr:hypothetical protein [Chlamydiales bacterium]